MGELCERFLAAARPPDGGLTRLAVNRLTICACLVAALAVTPPARGDAVTVGVNVVNPQRLSLADRDAILDQLQSAGVRVIRVPLASPWNGDDYGPAIDFVRRASERGIKAVLIVGLQYREGAQRRPAVKELPNIWSSYALSASDPVRFRAVFQPLFNQLEDSGITLAALELGNEINWTAFNGEFAIPGEGRVFGSEDLARDPEARRIADGYKAYLKTLSVLKDIRDNSRLNQATPILSAGLSDPGHSGPRPGSKTDAVTIGATLEFLRANGLDSLVDAYGVHTYPSAKTAAGRRNQLEEDTLAECRPIAAGKPCWLTEWGLPIGNQSCAEDDAPRAALTREILGNLTRFARQGQLMGLVCYAWGDARYGIYRCGKLTEAGRLALGFGKPDDVPKSGGS